MRQTPCATTVVKKHPVAMSGGVGCEGRTASTVFDVRRDQFAFRLATKVHDGHLVFTIEIVGIKGFLVEYQTNIIRALAFDVIGFADLFGNLCFGLARSCLSRTRRESRGDSGATTSRQSLCQHYR